jgi:putative acetyltransferase
MSDKGLRIAATATSNTNEKLMNLYFKRGYKVVFTNDEMVRLEKTLPVPMGQEKYLKGITLSWQPYRESRKVLAHCEFQRKLIAYNWPVFYAVGGDNVVGWADITPSSNPRLSHRGFLGMGLLKSHRGQGLGTQLLQAALGHAKKIGLEKVELSVYSENFAAIALYKKVGFQQMGFVKNYRKLEDRYFDCVEMEIFL